MMRKRNKFSLSNSKLLTCNMGDLVPLGLLEVLPGDGIQQQTTNMLRTIPMVSPPMHQVDMVTRHYFVPNRLLWDNWEDFITGGEDNDDASVHPTIDLSTAGVGQPAVGDLSDYFGLPVGTDLGTVSALPFRAYAFIWNEIIRDQDLQDPVGLSLADGPDTTTSIDVLLDNWERDYFTSAKPTPQKGAAQTVSLGSTAPVHGIALADGVIYTAAATGYSETGGAAPPAGNDWSTGTPPTLRVQGDNTTKIPKIFADLSSATGIAVTDLYHAIRLQDMAIARQRFGSKYVEYIRYLGGNPQDYRFQRPEFLGGGRQSIQFSEVLQTAEGTNNVGTLRGHGIGLSRSNRYRFQVPEHGYIISLGAVKPKTMYADGIPQHFLRADLEDYWQLELQNIGMRAVLNKEVYAAHATPNGTFGYNDRYEEYRRGINTIAGFMRTTDAGFHFGRTFGSDPALNSAFLECSPPKTPFVVTDPNEHAIQINSRHSIQARRLVSRDGRPLMSPRY